LSDIIALELPALHISRLMATILIIIDDDDDDERLFLISIYLPATTLNSTALYIKAQPLQKCSTPGPTAVNARRA
jgi:hypothetical protein